MKYLHIGNGVTVRSEDVIGIFDLDSSTISKTTKDYLKYHKEQGTLSYQDSDLPRSFIVCRDKVLLSRISAQGLYARSDEL